jgi:trehalose 6-phosphate synthase
MWSKQVLHDLVRSRIGDQKLVVVANREPYQHQYAGDQIVCIAPVSGMVTALHPILRACGGIWVAHGNGTADRATVDSRDHVQVPPDNPEYTLRRVWLSKRQVNGYYNGMANAGLWPLCHQVFVRPVYDPRHWPIYREVNRQFADTVLEEIGDAPALVFVQDYHYGLLARQLKEAAPQVIIAQFWHIPWPSADVFQTFPWKEELLDGLLGNDLLGFHLRYHCQNFLETVERTLEAKVDYERFEVLRGGKATLVRPFPIGIDFEGHDATARSGVVELEMARWKNTLQLSDQTLGIGIDRIDYTKGIPERLHALDLLLERQPELRGKLLFVQIGVPSRGEVAQYDALNREIDDLVGHLNWKWQTGAWRPIVYLKQQHSPVQMMALHRLAHFCVVSALDDGMNLVAKEFVASRFDEDGTLVLSKFTGAARELSQALLVNPFALDDLAQAIRAAITMPPEERRRRMQLLRQSVEQHNVFRWAGKMLSSLLAVEPAEPNDAATEESDRCLPQFSSI